MSRRGQRRAAVGFVGSRVTRGHERALATLRSPYPMPSVPPSVRWDPAIDRRPADRGRPADRPTTRGPTTTPRTNDRDPAEVSAGSRLMGVDAPWCTCGERGQDPSRRSLGGAAAGRPSPPGCPCRLAGWRGHHTSFPRWRGRSSRTPWMGRSPRTPRGGAAGSRTRVPRSRSWGLYVRRFRMISDTVLRSQTASVSIPPFDVPLGPAVRAVGVILVMSISTPLRGVRGGSSRVFRPR